MRDLRPVADLRTPSPDSAVRPDTATSSTLGTAAAAGSVLGALALTARDALGSPWSDLTGSVAVWCLLSCWAGQRGAPPSWRWSGLAGLCAQVGLVAGFYGALVVLAGRSESLLRVAAVMGAAGAAGLVFGLLGRLRWARGSWPLVPAAAVGAAFAFEALRGPATLYTSALRPLPPLAEHILPTVPELVQAVLWPVLGVAAAAALSPPERRLTAALVGATAVVAVAVVLVAVAATGL